MIEIPYSDQKPNFRARVSLDSDGVLFGFDRQCIERFGASSRELTFDCPQRGYLTGDEALWAHVDECDDFWTSMSLLPGAERLVELAKPFGLQILTGCPKTGFARAQHEKRIKFERYFPGVHVVTCLSKHKTQFMQEPGDVLVDDFIVNIRRWRKEGGYGVLYEKPDQAFADLEAGLRRQFPDIQP